MTIPKLPTPKPKRNNGQKGTPGRGFAGNGRNPGGRPRKIPKDEKAVLLAGNIKMLALLWRRAHSKNEAISLRAIEAWLKKTIPDATRLEISGPGGGAIPVADVRSMLEQRLMKLLADEAEEPPHVEGEVVQPAEDALVRTP